jgi:hypothetical protein
VIFAPPAPESRQRANRLRPKAGFGGQEAANTAKAAKAANTSHTNCCEPFALAA